ncbi:hypothetical protein LPH68_25135 [Bacteroides sp. 1_1_30]|nr:MULTISPECIES: hypothetical protein [Bacteroides]MBS5760776.1 hypothetical protein [Bacteroides sp.]MBS5770142.1 hypothetical protein [Bacteroides sp.]MBV3618591.1 hypothetical protein [Bacteroides xylanisolvens]MCD0223000.1 hypothetical protein [Bacteroides sp. 1_1_30]MCI5692362.1 hypothetical protein [Bacteroides xylanisolvens]
MNNAIISSGSSADFTASSKDLLLSSKHITLAQSRMCAMLDVATSRLTSSFFSADVVVEVFFDNRWVDRCNFRPVV